MCNEKNEFESTSDERIENNVMRHKYKTLSDNEKEQMSNVKDIGLTLHAYISTIGDSKEIEIAKQKVEEAVMWATKHITK